MADKSLEETVMANLQAKRANRRPYRDQRVNTASTSRGYGGVGKARRDFSSRGAENRGESGSGEEQRDRPSKLLISNLDFNVSEDDLKELYSPFGETRRIVMNYDRSGRSLGTAEIIYKKRGDAMKAMQQYNGVPLDGKKMELEVINSSGIGSVSGGGRNVPRMNPNSRPIPYGGRFQRNTGPPRNQEERIAAKADDLDKEMDAYFASKSNSSSKPTQEAKEVKPVEPEITEPEMTADGDGEDDNDLLDADV